MRTFLNQTAEYLLENYKLNFANVAIIFPSRRAGLMLKREIAKKTGEPLWLPDVQTINDFVFNNSGYHIADKLYLIIKLFNVYKEFEPGESFEKFYKWGEVLLNDFDYVDKYLVDPELIFKKIGSLKEIDERFPTELQDDFINFWKIFLGKETRIKADFIKTFRIIGDVYKNFVTLLQSENTAYEGMAYRKVCNELKENTSPILNKYKKVIFIGFNYLSLAEKNIISAIELKGKAEVIFDADKYYLNNNNYEAGKFLRKNISAFNQIDKSIIIDELLNSGKNITILSTPLQTGMVKAAGSELKNLAVSDFNEDQTAIVLPDEALLLPVLNSIPDSIKHINISMGFPFNSTPVYDLITLLKGLQKNVVLNNHKTLFHHLDCEKILLHPYIKLLLGKTSETELTEIYKNNSIYCNFSNSGMFLEKIFCFLSSAKSIISYLQEIFSAIADAVEKSVNYGDVYKNIQLEFINRLFLNLNILSDSFLSNNIEITSSAFWNLLTETLATLRVPFTGEPFKGLQILGLLETRSLDYENVFILSVNEGKLPSLSQKASFIPYTFRKYFGLPVVEDDDSSTSYYFYRLIQRAKNVILGFNSEPDENYKGKSRYLMQIEYELAKHNRNIILNEKIVTTPVSVTLPVAIEIAKDDDIMKKLMEKRKFSATALIDYISCPLKFYFKSVLEINEQKEVEESLEANTFGSIFHRLMKILYEKFLNIEITENELNELLKLVYSSYDKLFNEAIVEQKLGNSYLLLVAKNNIYKDIIKELVIKTLIQDKKSTPFKILSVESHYFISYKLLLRDSEVMQKELNGYIDRLEEKDGVWRIIDYKTGKKRLKTISENKIFENLESVFTNPEWKETFQALFYAFMLRKKCNIKNINAGMYYAKEISKGINFISEGIISGKVFEIFENKLNELFEKIYDINTPFAQTPAQSKECNYCLFKGVCYRK